MDAIFTSRCVADAGSTPAHRALVVLGRATDRLVLTVRTKRFDKRCTEGRGYEVLD